MRFLKVKTSGQALTDSMAIEYLTSDICKDSFTHDKESGEVIVRVADFWALDPKGKVRGEGDGKSTNNAFAAYIYGVSKDNTIRMQHFERLLSAAAHSILPDAADEQIADMAVVLPPRFRIHKTDQTNT